MTAAELFWFAAGCATGCLALMQLQVLASWRWRRRHPMTYQIHPRTGRGHQ